MPQPHQVVPSEGVLVGKEGGEGKEAVDGRQLRDETGGTDGREFFRRRRRTAGGTSLLHTHLVD